jgi:indolepyruvate ferredoxin oxidoreductase, beta subunit
MKETNMAESTRNIMIVGVGGQGVILASNILSEVALMGGFDVKKNEAHGQSQRSGSVSSHVRFGKKVYSPVIDQGEADIVLSFEELEALRWASYLKRGGKIIVNQQRIYPPSVTSGMDHYPDNVLDILRRGKMDVISIDGIALASRMGNVLVVSTLLLGVMSVFLKFPVKLWQAAIGQLVPEKHKDLNLNAFEEGRKWVRSQGSSVR